MRPFRRRRLNAGTTPEPLLTGWGTSGETTAKAGTPAAQAWRALVGGFLARSGKRDSRRTSGILIVIPISSSSPPLRIHVDVPAGEAGLSKPSRVKCDQIGKADIRRFRPGGKIGTVRPDTMRKLETVLRRLLVL